MKKTVKITKYFYFFSSVLEKLGGEWLLSLVDKSFDMKYEVC
jgi:hypothetical protein